MVVVNFEPFCGQLILQPRRDAGRSFKKLNNILVADAVVNFAVSKKKRENI
jgi:hypothetical protein